MESLGAGSNTVPVINMAAFLNRKKTVGVVGTVLPSLPACLFNPVITEIQLTAKMSMMKKE